MQPKSDLETMSKEYVAIEMKTCPFCGDEFSAGVLIQKNLRKIFDETTVNTGFEPCDGCNGYINEGMFALIEVDPSKSKIEVDNGVEILRNEGAYRTGKMAWVSKQIFLAIYTNLTFGSEPSGIPAMFVESGTLAYIEKKIEEWRQETNASDGENGLVN
jgi:hypothetical protein